MPLKRREASKRDRDVEKVHAAGLLSAQCRSKNVRFQVRGIITEEETGIREDCGYSKACHILTLLLSLPFPFCVCLSMGGL